MNNSESKYDINDIFNNENRFNLWELFSIFPELTLSDLSHYLKKSKSTIHPHLKILEEMDLIEEVREEKVRGQYKAKVYSLKKGYHEKFGNWGMQPNCKKEEIDVDLGMRMTENLQNWIQIQISKLELQKKFFATLQEDIQSPNPEEALKMLNTIYGIQLKEEKSHIISKKTLKAFGFIDEGTYQNFRELFAEFYKKLGEHIDEAEGDNPTIEKPYYFFMNTIPIKMIYQYLFKEEKK